MKKPILSDVEKALSSPYFEGFSTDVFAKNKKGGDIGPAEKIMDFYDRDYDSLSELEKDAFYRWHKYRVFELEGVSAILPKNVETFTIVTALGHVCIIRKPIGRVLGNVMAKLQTFNKEVDYYEAGSAILKECKIHMEKPIESNPDELFSVKMSCLGSVQMLESTIKKN